MAGFEPAHTRVKVLCLNRLATPHRCPSENKWGGRRDSNPRPSEPQSDILTRLNYAHHINFSDELPPHTHALAGRSPPGERRAFGASAGIRTLDLRLRRPLLYPAELQAHSGVPVTHFNKDRRSCQLLFGEFFLFVFAAAILVLLAAAAGAGIVAAHLDGRDENLGGAISLGDLMALLLGQNAVEKLREAAE